MDFVPFVRKKLLESGTKPRKDLWLQIKIFFYIAIKIL